MWRMLTVTGVWLSLLSLVGPGSAAPPPFSGDSHFAARLTLSVRDQPLWEVVGHLRAAEHLPIRVDRSTQDERVTLFCRQRTASDVLAAIAKHLDYSWSAPRQEGGDWTLTQTPAQQKRERLARQALQDRSQDEFLKTLQRMAEQGRMTQEQRFAEIVRSHEKEAAALRKLLDRGQTSVKQQLEYAEGAAAAARQGRYRYCRPAGEAEGAAAALSMLDPPEMEALWRGEMIRFSYPPRHDRRPLTQAQAERMVRSEVETRYGATTEDGYLVPRPFSGVEQVRAELWLDAGKGTPALHFLCRYMARRPEGREEAGMRADIPAMPIALMKTETPAVDESDAELRRPISLPRVKSAVLPDVPLSDALAALDGLTPYMLIGDSYATGYRTGVDFKRGQRLPLEQWLKSVCRALSVSARREGDTLFFRHHAWAALRPVQLPDRLSRPWIALLATRHTLPLSKLAEMSRAASKEQMALAGLDWTVRRLLPLGDLRLLESNLGLDVDEITQGDKSWEVCQLLSTLTPVEWAALQRPESPLLPYRHPVPPRLATELLDDMSLTSEIQENPPKDMVDDPRAEAFRRPFGAAIRISDALDDGKLLRVGVQRAGTTVFVTRDGFGLADNPEEALQQVKRWDDEATAEKLTPVKVTHCMVRLLLDPESSHALQYHFFTSDAGQ